MVLLNIMSMLRSQYPSALDLISISMSVYFFAETEISRSVFDIYKTMISQKPDKLTSFGHNNPQKKHKEIYV